MRHRSDAILKITGAKIATIQINAMYRKHIFFRWKKCIEGIFGLQIYQGGWYLRRQSKDWTSTCKPGGPLGHVWSQHYLPGNKVLRSSLVFSNHDR